MQQVLLHKLSQQEKKLESQEERIREQNQKYIQQANKHAEIIAKLTIKSEQNHNLIQGQEEFMKTMSQNIQRQFNQRAQADSDQDGKIGELHKALNVLKQEQQERHNNFDEVITNLIQKFDAKINHVYDLQLRQQEQSDAFEKFVIEQVKKQ